MFTPPGIAKELADAIVRDRVESAAKLRQGELLRAESVADEFVARVGAVGRRRFVRRGSTIRHGAIRLEGPHS